MKVKSWLTAALVYLLHLNYFKSYRRSKGGTWWKIHFPEAQTGVGSGMDEWVSSLPEGEDYIILRVETY